MFLSRSENRLDKSENNQRFLDDIALEMLIMLYYSPPNSIVQRLCSDHISYMLSLISAGLVCDEGDHYFLLTDAGVDAVCLLGPTRRLNAVYKLGRREHWRTCVFSFLLEELTIALTHSEFDIRQFALERLQECLSQEPTAVFPKYLTSDYKSVRTAYRDELVSRVGDL